MRVSFNQKGDFKKTTDFLKHAKDVNIENILSKYGQEGVNLLSKNTPANTGLTASSWFYKVEKKGNKSYLSWCNSNVNNGVNIAIILQYGHGTGTGGWVSGRDYINPAIKPLFDKIANQVWKEVAEYGPKY